MEDGKWWVSDLVNKEMGRWKDGWMDGWMDGVLGTMGHPVPPREASISLSPEVMIQKMMNGSWAEPA
jgi:hypothetical protein